MNELNNLKNEVEVIDWNEIKSVLNTILNLLQGLCEILPSTSIMKNILCGIVSILKIALSMIPLSTQQEK